MSCSVHWCRERQQRQQMGTGRMTTVTAQSFQQPGMVSFQLLTILCLICYRISAIDSSNDNWKHFRLALTDYGAQWLLTCTLEILLITYWRLRGNIIRTALCWVVWHNVHSQHHTHMSSSYRSSRLGLSHWDPYAMHRGGCLELYYCNMVEWSWRDSGLICNTNWFPSVLWHCWFGHIWPVKIVPEMTYNVSSGTLSLYTTTTTLDGLHSVTSEDDVRKQWKKERVHRI